MANIKVSELPTASSFGDSDYAMIVQSGDSKKITKQTMMQSTSNEIANLLKIDTMTSTTSSINANTEATFNISITSVQGYTPIGTLYIDTQNGIDVMKWSIYSNTLYVRVRNVTSSVISTTITAQILYLKNYS